MATSIQDPVALRAARGRRFLRRAVEVHGDTYDYSKVEYESVHAHVVIVCPEHGDFQQRPNAHLRGRGCYPCAMRDKGAAELATSGAVLLAKFERVHGDRYDYSRVDYAGMRAMVTIICVEHGPFNQRPSAHLQGQGCERCSAEKRSEAQSMTTEEFLDRAVAAHGEGAYDYSRVQVSNSSTPVTILCPSHGAFSQAPSQHLIGRGCGACASSYGETAIRNALEESGIEYVAEWSHPSLRDVKPLRFDFALPDRAVLIEFDGPHHRGPVRFGGMPQERAEAIFEGVQRRDRIKAEWAAKNGWTLVRIENRRKIIADLIETGVLPAPANSPHDE